MAGAFPLSFPPVLFPDDMVVVVVGGDGGVSWGRLTDVGVVGVGATRVATSSDVIDSSKRPSRSRSARVSGVGRLVSVVPL